MVYAYYSIVIDLIFGFHWNNENITINQMILLLSLAS
uniref:Uncharacterized protein n=1 Tax=Lepeophtheirus salmonis TaxID=72036 RepID=A0A0K2V1K2_LEPSM